ncbi:hypothetical protein GGD45_002095 [Rhizobium tropici]|uniref:Uncharacterized protein n=1 Tax=Rhizobium tropici TaxID=398 RepID=A0ABR6QXP3_RHITR|nr:hypothetical protein [Rhizobium tropici]MBB6491693.1 hypothetical protein [Rhizobium tropici]
MASNNDCFRRRPLTLTLSPQAGRGDCPANAFKLKETQLISVYAGQAASCP